MIEVRGAVFEYPLPGGPVRVLDRIDLTIREGESIAVIGPNGSGKTTLARCLNGLLIPTAGEVRVDELSTADPEGVWQVRRAVGMVFQSPDDQIVSTVVEREIAFGLENMGLSPPEIRRRVSAALRRFGLERYRHHAPHRLSGGEKQRLAIASVLAMGPKYIILDEPTALLDPKGCKEVQEALRELTRDGITTVHITQSPDEAAEALRVIVLDRGRVINDGPPEAVFAEVERLREIGLEAPFAAEVSARLRQKGVAVRPGVLTVPALVEALGAKRLPARTMKRSYARTLRRSYDLPTSTAGRDGARSEPDKLAVEEVWHLYDRALPTEVAALRGVTLSVRPGECVALIGGSGSGKTTLAQHLNGLLRPDGGRVLVDGRDLWAKGTDRREIRRRVGLIFQFPEFQLFEETVAHDVAFGPRHLGWDEVKVQGAVVAALGAVALDPEWFGRRHPLALSGGERRRVAIAGVLSMGPDVLVLDEPTAGLDPKGQGQMEGILRQLHSEGRTILLIAHDMDLVAALADRVVALQDGRIALEGPPGAIFRDPSILTPLGLDLPEAAHLLRALRGKGWAIRADALTLDGVATAILEILLHLPTA